MFGIRRNGVQLQEQKRSGKKICAFFMMLSVILFWTGIHVWHNRKNARDVGAILWECIRLLLFMVAALHLRHGVKPSGASYQYIVLPAATKKEVEEFDPKMIRVIKNDKVAQVVSSPSCGEGYWMAVYQSENFDIEGLFFKAVLPGIYYVEKGLGGLEIKLSSPFRISK